MRESRLHTYLVSLISIVFISCIATMSARAETEWQDTTIVGKREAKDTLKAESQANDIAIKEKKDTVVLSAEKIQKQIQTLTKPRIPNAQRAMWLAIAFPGAGQIYNRKYWKLPIIYGGFVGCLYALQWNNTMYKDYSQAYLDIMDDDPSTASYNQYLHLGSKVTPENLAHYKNVFKQRKDKFRKWRDMSIFCLIGVYALSVIDAYVDASLSEFDISKDLSLSVKPSVISQNQNKPKLSTSWAEMALGLQCSIRF